MNRESFVHHFEQVVTNVKTVIKGKDNVIRYALVALLSEGHLLFEDVPGTGKTMLARSIAQTINAKVSRIQCTPDLLPGDVTGSPILDRKSGDFFFRPGPIFANIVVVDEVNRATPKTQSALLEAMQEHTVTIDGVTHPLPRPFFVVATQNPIELAGTFPLPEAQLDRFLFKLAVGYPERVAESSILDVHRAADVLSAMKPVIDTDTVSALISWASGVTVAEAVRLYIIDIARATREDPALELGASPRATLALQRAAQVLAASQNRDDVIPDDVKGVVVPTLTHRLVLTADAQLRDESVEQVIERILSRVRVPLGLGASA